MCSWRRPDRLEEKLIGPPRLGEKYTRARGSWVVQPQTTLSFHPLSTPAWGITALEVSERPLIDRQVRKTKMKLHLTTTILERPENKTSFVFIFYSPLKNQVLVY